jgi:hypothetical protein
MFITIRTVGETLRRKQGVARHFYRAFFTNGESFPSLSASSPSVQQSFNSKSPKLNHQFLSSKIERLLD